MLQKLLKLKRIPEILTYKRTISGIEYDFSLTYLPSHSLYMIWFNIHEKKKHSLMNSWEGIKHLNKIKQTISEIMYEIKSSYNIDTFWFIASKENYARQERKQVIQNDLENIIKTDDGLFSKKELIIKFLACWNHTIETSNNFLWISTFTIKNWEIENPWYEWWNPHIKEHTVNVYLDHLYFNENLVIWLNKLLPKEIKINHKDNKTALRQRRELYKRRINSNSKIINLWEETIYEKKFVYTITKIKLAE